MYPRKPIFDKDTHYTYDEIMEGIAGTRLVITDCLEDERPHLTVGLGEFGDPLWQFEQDGDRFFVGWNDERVWIGDGPQPLDGEDVRLK
jgi:hypothetical protein